MKGVVVATSSKKAVAGNIDDSFASLCLSDS